MISLLVQISQYLVKTETDNITELKLQTWMAVVLWKVDTLDLPFKLLSHLVCMLVRLNADM